MARAAVSYLLAGCEAFSPTNMTALSELLVGPSSAAGVRCLYDYPKGRLLLRLAARQWHFIIVQAPGLAGERGTVTVAAAWDVCAL